MHPITQPRKLDSSSVFLCLTPHTPANHPVLPALLPEPFSHRLAFTSTVAAAIQMVSISSDERMFVSALASLSPLSTPHTESAMGQRSLRISCHLCHSEQKHKLRRMASPGGTSLDPFPVLSILYFTFWNPAIWGYLCAVMWLSLFAQAVSF